ncbi:2TM domain-containing protein [Psychroserpens sp. XS_ASV72]|uniref:2TM domain-containing protein n=1 Tax=Psychroserpens sp. XS_ASV72 TaxID=3241293 RepID=UPI00351294F5
MENQIEPYKSDQQRAFEREEAYLRAQKKVKNLIGFYWHLASYVIINIFIICLIVFNGGRFWSFGTFATAIFWGIGLLFHFLGVFGPDFMFGKNWEERKIREYMDKDQKHWE